ncbi:S1 RNA-binding domain-containing protein [Amycolatopsis sp. CA-126428]|uniref:S1 RNA-binding domain-containing protein n=1 Tax=Amycolatopsis sp. CA-126428 TaxID=2073158 RepID=UPI001E28738A|nr:S1 RNA-binding domain-containing protein [Amycolatopsis sp. CA-126428]
MTVANPGWGYVLDHKLSRVDGRARERVLEAAVDWLVHPGATTNPAWSHVAQALLRETQGELLAKVENAALEWLSDEDSHRTNTWHYLYRRMLEEISPSPRRLRLIELGRVWLQSPDSFSPNWPIVFDTLHSTLEVDERKELLRAATGWVLDETRFSDSNWINVCSSLMRHLDSREFAAVLVLATTWVREPMNQFLSHWSKILERLIRVAEFTERGDLVGIGMQWLREWIDQDDPRWGSVVQTLLRATDGTDQTELLALARRWIDSEPARDDPLWPAVVVNIVERTPGTGQAPILETAVRWLGTSVHQPGRGWTRLLELLVDSDHAREVLGKCSTNRLIGRGQFRNVEDWGDVYALAVRSDLVLDRGELAEAGLNFLRTRSFDDRLDRSQVVSGLLSELEDRQRAELVRLELLWLWNRNNWRFPSWNRVFQTVLQAVPDQRRELRQLGLQWLRNVPGNPGWGWVLEQVHPLTRGQEKEQLAAFLWTWFADPVNRDGPAFSKAIECAVTMTDTAALDMDDIHALGLSWLALGRNFAGRRWSFVFRALGERRSPEHSTELVDVAVAWLSDSRSREDQGWPYVLGTAADLANQKHLGPLHELAESWLTDPVNWGDPGWGYVAGRVSKMPSGLSGPTLAAARRWLALPLTRRGRTWRQGWTHLAPLLDHAATAAVLTARLNDAWMQSSPLWGFRYLDASGHVDLSASAVGEQVVEWCSRERCSKTSAWPHVVALGLKAADPTARTALTRLAEAWLLDPANTSGRGTVETALLGSIEFDDVASSETRQAIVSNVLDYGAFVNLGGRQGLIHRSEMANGRTDPRKVLRLGQRVTVRVLKIDADTGKIAVSLRSQNPIKRQLDAAREALPPRDLASCSPGTNLDGVVTGITDYGLFIDVGGVSGLAHKSRIAGSPELPGTFAIGQQVQCRVVSVEPARNRLSLSLGPQTSGARNSTTSAESEPQVSLGTCNEGDLLDGVVTRVVPYGVFVDVDGLRGLLHNKEMEPAGPRCRARVAQQGSHVRVRVCRVDRERGRVDFSLLNLPSAETGTSRSP